MEKITSNEIKSQLQKGDRLIQIIELFYGKNKRQENRYTVTSTRKSGNGRRVHATHDAGYGVTDLDFEYDPATNPLSNAKSIEWFLER